MSIWVKTDSSISKIVEPLIIKGDKSIGSWSTWSFVYGDGTFAYVFIPGIHVTDSTECSVTFSSNQNLIIKTYTGNEITFTVYEHLKAHQQYQGIMCSFKHGGIGYITYGIITTDLTIHP